jgi:hypothetical protein
MNSAGMSVILMWTYSGVGHWGIDVEVLEVD